MSPREKYRIGTTTTSTTNYQPEFFTTGQATPIAALDCHNNHVSSQNHTEHFYSFCHQSHPTPLGLAVHTAALTHHHHPTFSGQAVPSAALHYHIHPTTIGQAVPSAALHDHIHPTPIGQAVSSARYYHTHPTPIGQAVPTAAQNHHTLSIIPNHPHRSIIQNFNNVTTKYKYRNKNTRKTAFKHARKETQQLINRERYITNLSSKTLNHQKLTCQIPSATLIGAIG